MKPLTARKWRQWWDRLRNGVRCPRCLATHSLVSDKRGTFCNQCYMFFQDPSILKTAHVCFATCGIRAGGKLHWTLAFLDAVRTAQTQGEVAWVPCEPSAEEDADRLIAVLKADHNTEGTIYIKDRVPCPLAFAVRKNTRFGRRTSGHMFLFNIPGETLHQSSESCRVKQRLLTMDGLLYFLDPRSVFPDRLWLNRDDQRNRLLDMIRELHVAHAVQSDKPLNLPVAVCIPKLDLISMHNPLGSAGFQLLDELRATEHQPITRNLIETRSKIVGRYLQEMFFGWNIERDLKDNFGSRYMFFPLTPVNINADEIGVEDLAQRSRNPFGIQEPILWLLHISGYSVLK